MKASFAIETLNVRSNAPATALPESLAPMIVALRQQTFRDFEVIIVTDDGVSAATEEELRRRYPEVIVARAHAQSYYAAKNTGAAMARGEIVCFIDCDCLPAPDWLSVIVARFEDPSVSLVTGGTRYVGDSFAARTFSVPDLSHVTLPDGNASGFNLSNVAYRRDVLLKYPLDERVRRDGACYLSYHRMRQDGVRIVYEPQARVEHGLDIRGFGFFRKHFGRGYDGVSVYRFDDRAVLRGTRLFRKFGGAALVAFTGRRIVLDWVRMTKHRGQLAISPLKLPYYFAVATGTRLIELVGGFTALLRK